MIVTVVERLRLPSVDPVAGWTFVATESASTVWFVVETIMRRLRLSPDAQARLGQDFPLWAYLGDDLLNLAVIVVLGLGMVRGRAWALWLQGLISLRIAFNGIAYPHNGPLGLHRDMLFGFSVLVFVYAGLRILGVLGDGPRPLFRKVDPGF